MDNFNISKLICLLDLLGIKVSIVGQNLEITDPNNNLTDELIEKIKNNKKDLLNILSNNKSKHGFKPIKSVEKKEYYDLSFSQAVFFLLYSLYPNSILYNVPTAFQINFKLDEEKLINVIQYLVINNEILRTIFAEVNNSSVQIILEKVEVEIEWYKCNKSGIDKTIERFIRPFHIDKAPLFRIAIVDIHEGGSLFIMDMHHIITDEVSSKLLISQIVNRYLGKQIQKPKLQYKDFSYWQKLNLSSNKLENQFKFWKEELKDGSFKLELPTDFKRPLTRSYKGEMISFELDDLQTQIINNLKRDYNCTLFNVFTLILTILINKLSNQEVILIGIPVSGRNHPDLENQLGVFLNTVCIKTEVQGNLDFDTFFKGIITKTIEVLSNQDYPFNNLIDKLNAERNPSRNPYFEVMLTVQNRENRPLSKNDLNIKEVSFDNRTAKFDLTFNIIEVKNIIIQLNYNTEIFLSTTINRYIGYLKQLISNFADININTKVKDIHIIDQNEKLKILNEFNNTYIEHDELLSVIDLFHQNVKKYPFRIALTYHGTMLSYSFLDELANHFALQLIEYGAKPNEITCLLVEPSIKMIIALLAIQKCSCLFLPIDPNFPNKRIEYILKDCNCKILVSESVEQNILDFEGNFLYIDIQKLKNKGRPKQHLQINTANVNYVYIIYTSGSTGVPKGVLINTSNIVNYLKWLSCYAKIVNTDRTVLNASYSFDMGYSNILGSLTKGANLHILKKRDYLDQNYLLKYLIENEITFIKLTPTQFGNLIRNIFVTGSELRSLRFVILGGEEINSSDIKKFKDRFKNIDIYNEYGPTETTIGASICKLNDYNNVRCFSNIGVPGSNMQVYIFDSYMDPVPVGVIGELYIGGRGVGEGYINNVDLTSQRFLMYKDKRIYKTGDLAYWTESGNIIYVGREDNQIKIKGYRIELDEIKKYLLSYNGINEVAIIAETQDENKILVAFFVAKEKKKEQDIHLYLLQFLPDFMIPNKLIQLDNMPLNLNGKINYEHLRKLIFEYEQEIELTNDKTEEILINIWGEVLSMPISKISVNSNFFELGGNSSLLVKLHSKIEKLLDIKIDITDLFKYTTIRLFANTLGRSIQNLQTSEDIIDHSVNTFFDSIEGLKY